METVIERQRRQHEECERLENALSEELLLKKQTVYTHGSQFKYCYIFVYVFMIGKKSLKVSRQSCIIVVCVLELR